MPMFFGQKLKEMRLKHANMGLHNFAEKIEMRPSEYSDIERGLAPPPDDMEWFWKIVYALGLGSDMVAQLELTNSLREPFVMQKMNENFIPRPGVRKTDGTLLNAEELTKLVEHINSIAREHNKKADEYNKKHGNQ